MVAMPQSKITRRAEALVGFIPRLKPKGYLVLFLTLTFFLFCPLWTYLSVCGMHWSDDVGQECFLYSFVFNMLLSLPALAALLVTLVFFQFIADDRQSPIFHVPTSWVFARAPPLS